MATEPAPRLGGGEPSQPATIATKHAIASRATQPFRFEAIVEALPLLRFKRIREDERFEQLPVIIVSAQVCVRDVGLFLDQGATAFLPKPVDREALADYLKRYLDESQLRSPLCPLAR